MGRLCWALLGLLSVACCGADGATHQQLRTSTAGPAFLWSDAGEYFLRGPKQAAGKVAYEEVRLQDLMGPLLGQLLGVQSAEHPLLNAGALQQSPPQLVVVVVGDKLSTEQLASGGKALAPVKAVLQAAAARLSLPNVAHPPTSNLSAQALATASAAGLGGRVHALGACAPDAVAAPASAAALQALLARLPRSSGTQAVVVCTSAATLAAEAALVADLHSAAASDGRPSVFLYAASPPAQGVGVRARSLLSAPGQSYVCDAKCETQACTLHVRLLEAFILSLTLISALLTGTCMLHMLCTPTRFEAPKGERSHGDT